MESIWRRAKILALVVLSVGVSYFVSFGPVMAWRYFGSPAWVESLTNHVYHPIFVCMVDRGSDAGRFFTRYERVCIDLFKEDDGEIIYECYS